MKGLAPVYIWVQSKHNPADRPSRINEQEACWSSLEDGDEKEGNEKSTPRGIQDGSNEEGYIESVSQAKAH